MAERAPLRRVVAFTYVYRGAYRLDLECGHKRMMFNATAEEAADRKRAGCYDCQRRQQEASQ